MEDKIFKVLVRMINDFNRAKALGDLLCGRNCIEESISYRDKATTLSFYIVEILGALNFNDWHVDEDGLIIIDALLN